MSHMSIDWLAIYLHNIMQSVTYPGEILQSLGATKVALKLT